MIQTKQIGLQEVLSAAIKRATDEKILVSFVKQIDWMDPLLFYAAGKRISFENRCYFADPAQHVIFAGIGSVFTIATASRKRFQTARDEWDKVKEKAFVQRKNTSLEQVLFYLVDFHLTKKKRKQIYGKNLMIRHFHYQHFY